MATPALKRKSATETLLDRFSELVDEQSTKLTPAQFKKADKKFNKVIENARARSSRRGKA